MSVAPALHLLDAVIMDVNELPRLVVEALGLGVVLPACLNALNATLLGISHDMRFNMLT